MNALVDRLSLRFKRRLPLILQTEATECGLACLCMIAGFHGHSVDLASLRRRHPVSLKGATLATLIGVANQLELATRPLKLDLDHLRELRLPCILHWEFNHFVVLCAVGSRRVTIADPAGGVQHLSYREVGERFTGIALELWPNPRFTIQRAQPSRRLRELLGPVTGLSRSFAQILCAALAMEVFSLTAPFFQQWVIDDVLVSGDRDLLVTLAAGFGLLVITQQLVGAVRGWFLMVLGVSLGVQWRANVFSHALRLPVSYFEKRHLGDVVSRFGSIDIIQRTLTTSFLEAILDGLMTVATLTLMFVYSPSLACIAVAAMTLYGVLRWLGFGAMRHATADQIVHAARQQSHFLETVRGVKTIKLFGRQDVRRSSWLAHLVDQINAELRIQKLALLYRFLNGLLFGIENVLIIWLGATLVMDGNFSVGVLVAFTAYKMQFDARVSSLIDKFVEVRMLQLQGERLSDVVSHEPEPSDARSFDNAAPRPAATLEVHGLRFRYAEHEPYVLDGVNLSIAAGECVAVVGPSGSGKTTLLHVLLGVLSAGEGEVRVGGIPVAQLGTDALRRMVATVLQDDVLFAGSIADNICFFDERADQAWIEQCATLAAIHRDSTAMPMGYNTLVGDMGTVLSGGQKQRVLLARALYKRPSILLLDEATSHLDLERERAVNTAIRDLKVTRIIVAHRPETIASADRILVLVHGRIERELAPSGARSAAGQTSIGEAVRAEPIGS